MAHQETPRVPVPGEGSFHDPAPAVAWGPAEFLAGRLPSPHPFGNAGGDASSSELLPKRLAVVAPVGYEPLRVFPWTPPLLWDGHSGQHLWRQREFVRLGRCQHARHGDARFLDEHHPFGSLALFGLADPSAPLFAGAKLPSR